MKSAIIINLVIIALIIVGLLWFLGAFNSGSPIFNQAAGILFGTF